MDIDIREFLTKSKTVQRHLLTLQPGETFSLPLSSGGYWFGHGFNHTQFYPLETGEIVASPFAVNNIQCPVWMCSEGALVFADTNALLSVSINKDHDDRLRVTCPEKSIDITIYAACNLPQAHAAWLNDIHWPNRSPNQVAFGDSFFCTWTQYPRCINQQRIISMARSIREKNYPCHILIIDDRWEGCFGELQFSSADFPDPSAMFDQLKSMGFETWLWVTPFVNQEASCFLSLSEEKILVQDRSGSGAATFRWWGGTAGLFDLSAENGREYYRRKLQALMDLGADGFKIDGGDYKYQPAPEKCAWAADPGASGFSDHFLSVFESLVPCHCESRTAWRSQHRDIIVRQGGKDSHWGQDNGLKALVSQGLHSALLGYDLLIPDMVPGRVQTLDSTYPLSGDELMVRWTEVSTFFPFLQFSYYPWNYCAETDAIVFGYARLHKSLGPYIADQAANRLAPLLRPVWYDAPHEMDLYSIPDQFLLGSDLLVAPVLDPKTTQRDIFLPSGSWIDAWTGEQVSGRHSAYPAPCPGIPVFVHKRNVGLFDLVHRALQDIPRKTVPTTRFSAKYEAGLDRDITITG